MKKISFKQQIVFGIFLLLVSFFLGQLFKNGIFHNIAWVIYGIAFVVNPVWPQSWNYADPDKMKQGARIAGVICIFVGILTRFGV